MSEATPHCSVCLDALSIHPVLALPCAHVFHHSFVLTAVSNTHTHEFACPLCRYVLDQSKILAKVPSQVAVNSVSCSATRNSTIQDTADADCLGRFSVEERDMAVADEEWKTWVRDTPLGTEMRERDMAAADEEWEQTVTDAADSPQPEAGARIGRVARMDTFFEDSDGSRGESGDARE